MKRIYVFFLCLLVNLAVLWLLIVSDVAIVEGLFWLSILGSTVVVTCLIFDRPKKPKIASYEDLFRHTYKDFWG